MANSGERLVGVAVSEDTLTVDLADGRTISAPLAWYPKLLHATPEERGNWVLAGAGYGIHWPEIDEDLSSEGLLRGAPASRLHAGRAIQSVSTQAESTPGDDLSLIMDQAAIITEWKRSLFITSFWGVMTAPPAPGRGGPPH